MSENSKKPNILKKISQRADPKFAFILALSVLVIINLGELVGEIKKTKKIRKTIPHIFFGVQFSGLNKTFKDIEHVGYYTDKDMDIRANAAQYAQAQYELAPVILDLDYQKHRYILFDCTTEAAALEKIKELGAVAIKKNQFGLILGKQKP